MNGTGNKFLPAYQCTHSIKRQIQFFNEAESKKVESTHISQIKSNRLSSGTGPNDKKIKINVRKAVIQCYVPGRKRRVRKSVESTDEEKFPNLCNEINV